jgi:hypothetical protein
MQITLIGETLQHDLIIKTQEVNGNNTNWQNTDT